MHGKHVKKCSEQRGAVLIVSLVFLLVMTLVTTSGMRTTVLEEKMAGNMRDKAISFQFGEAAIRQGEGWLGNLGIRPETCNNAGSCNAGQVWSRFEQLDVSQTETAFWPTAGNDVRDFTLEATSGLAATTPKYTIQHIACVRDSVVLLGGVTEDLDDCSGKGRDFYRIVSRSSGGSMSADSVLETTFTRRF